MSPLEIISRLCDVTETLSAIVKKQQTIIEQSKIEETVRADRQGDGCSRIPHAEILRHRRPRGDRVRKGERR